MGKKPGSSRIRSKRKRIPLFDLRLSRRTERRVQETLRGGWLTTGPRAAELERQVAERLGARHAVAVSSATVGLLLGLRALGVSSGDEVITSPFTFVATIEAILHSGARPVLADINCDTLGLDPGAVADKISKRTACILPVELAGHPVDYKKLRPLATAHSLPLLSDASHAFGATFNGRTIPQLADVAVYSFHSTKNLTCGEGGMVVSRSKSVAAKVRRLSLHGLTSGAYQRRLKETWAYDVTDLGYKGNLSDVLASIALGELESFEKNQTLRASLAERYQRHLAPLGEFIQLPVVREGVGHAWHLYIIRLNLSRLRISRARFISLMSEHGIECGVHYRPVFGLSYYRGLGLTDRGLPCAVKAGREVVSLPLFPGLKHSDVDHICATISKIVSQSAR